MKKLILATCLVALASCGVKSAEEPTPTVESVAPPPPIFVDKTGISACGENAIYGISKDFVDNISFKDDGVTATEFDGLMVVSGTIIETFSGGHVSGVSFQLSDEAERKASGRSITVSVSARAEGSDTAVLSAAYSTNELGNSNWQDMEFGSEITTQSFDMFVNKMVAGKGDFVGVHPNGGSVAIEKICIN